VTSGIVLGIGLGFHDHAPEQAAVALAFTNLQPTRSGATTSAGRQKKAWGSAGKSLVMGWVAMRVTLK